jgi:hypothetical protein
VGISEAISHETGHTLGLHHDGREIPGTGHEEYFFGQGSGDTGWCPIMGASYYQPVTQWSKGEYQYANNQEDDTAIISNTGNGFGYVSDEAGGTIATAASLSISGGAINQAGVVALPTDADFYGFSTTGGGINITVTPADPSPNLDVSIEVQNPSGGVLATSNPADALNASILVSLPAGNYYLKVQGSGANSPFTTGYSNYGSIGEYTVTGSVPGGGRIGSQQNLSPYQPGGWSDKIVVSNITGSTTDATTLFAADTLYLDWAVINNGSSDITTSFTTELYVDGVLRNSWTASPPTNANFYRSIPDYNLGSLSVGTHTLRIKTDSTNAVAESNENDNEYIKTISVVNNTPPNLTPYQPAGWSSKIVVSKVTGSNTDDATLGTTDTLYLDWAAINNGTSDIAADFITELYVDGALKASWTSPPPTKASYYRYVQDYSLGSLSSGTHTLRIKVDSTNTISESNENDNEFTKTITVTGISSQPNLTPYQPGGWSDKIVVSNVIGTNVDSANLKATDTLYLDWAVINNGNADITTNFITELYVDGVFRTEWTNSPPTNVNGYRYVQDYNLGSLSVGSHTLRIKGDSTHVIAEQNEGDNEYTRTIVITTPTPTVATPVIAPNGGSYSSSVQVSLSCATSGASIYYTTNGSDPTAGSNVYSQPFTLTSSATVKAQGVKTGSNDSQIVSSVFAITAPPLQVTNLNSQGAGSLLEALTVANSTPSVKAITFNLPGPGPWTITTSTTLSITAPVLIDGTSQNGYDGAFNRVYVEGASGVSNVFSLVDHGGTTIKGLGIYNYENDGVAIGSSASWNFVDDCYIGFKSTATGILRNVSRAPSCTGVEITGSYNKVRRTTISGVYNGINIGEPIEQPTGLVSHDNLFEYNRIGTDPLGQTTSGYENTSTGILLRAGVQSSWIGGYNVIAGNGGSAVEIVHPSSFGNRVYYNYLGVNDGGTKVIDGRTNDQAILIGNVARNNGAWGNVVAGNRKAGIVVNSGDGNWIWNNTIGLNQSQTVALGGQPSGIVLNVDAAHSPGVSPVRNSIQGNMICNQSLNGIEIYNGVGNGIYNNWIGTNSAGQPFANVNWGVYLQDSSYNTGFGNAWGPNGLGRVGQSGGNGNSIF